MNTDATYGQRSCLFCGKTFEAVKLYQFFCSSECRLNRKRQRNREYETRRDQRREAELAALRARVAELEEEIEFLKRTESHELKEARKELEQLRAELEALRKESLPLVEKKFSLKALIQEQAPLRRTVEHPVNRAAPAVDTSGWDFCQRMQLRARLLPCGEREECEGCTRLGGNRRTLSGPLEERVCPVCGKTFAPEKSNSKYCSPICRKRAGKAREKQVGKG
jgi:predicted nucleic acid-binding Zn ribbon protein